MDFLLNFIDSFGLELNNLYMIAISGRLRLKNYPVTKKEVLSCLYPKRAKTCVNLRIGVP